MQLHYFTAILFMGSVLQSYGVVINCKKDVDTVCFMLDLHSEVLDNHFNILKDRTLITQCDNFLESVHCHREYFRICSPSSLEAYRALTDGVEAMMRDLCDVNSTFRAAHELHSPCLANTTEELEECIRVGIIAVANLDYIDPMFKENPKREVFFKFAKFYDVFRKCAVEKVMDICGTAASEHFKSLMQQSLGILEEFTDLVSRLF